MSEMGRSGGLRVIFSFFLGLMLTALVGVGVYTFRSPPHREISAQIQQLHRREQAIISSRPPNELTTADRRQIQEVISQRNGLEDAEQVARNAWGRITSIILIAVATLVMAVSLVRADQLPVISNGLLLGGLFTMVYGVGWIIATEKSVARFIVMVVALVITLTLGYVRFVRRKRITALPDGPRITEGEGLADIERRVRDLEERMNGAANALGHKTDHSRAT